MKKQLKIIYDENATAVSDKGTLKYVRDVLDTMEGYKELMFSNILVLYVAQALVIDRQDIELTISDGTNEEVCPDDMTINWQNLDIPDLNSKYIRHVVLGGIEIRKAKRLEKTIDINTVT